MKKEKIFALLFCLLCKYAISDKPTNLPIDTIALEAIEITANRLVNFTTGTKVERINTKKKLEFNSSSLSELLAHNSLLTIKSYGFSGISNVSLRGMNSKHTAVIWNGINLQNSMNGGFDMNSIPSFFIDNIDIQHGGSGALFGSGAIGGAIHLNNNLRFGKKLNIEYNQQIGSFDNYFEGLKVDATTNRFVNSTRIYHKYGRNDFLHKNTQKFGHPKEKQENAQKKQYGILQSNSFKINNKQKITTNLWTQQNYSEIPPMISNTISRQHQNTDLFRASAIWNRNGVTSSWFTRFYYNYEYLNYIDSVLQIDSKMQNENYLLEIENKTSIGDHILLNMGANNCYELVKTSNYNNHQYRNRTALYTSAKYYNTTKTFVSVLSLREELVDKQLSPFTFSLSSNYQINKYFDARINISRTYNLPGFNDLYWSPGGNSELKSEKGWNQDLGFNFHYTLGRHNLGVGISAFNILLSNSIVWVPWGAYWKAENVEKLWSRGSEQKIEYYYKGTNWQLRSMLMYDYTKSTYENKESINIANKGKQLMYTPKHKTILNLLLAYKKIRLNYTHNFVGKRYITKDNSSYVKPYNVGNLSVGTNYQITSSSFDISFKVNNVWNKVYEVMAFYAMPLRYYSVNIRYNFNRTYNTKRTLK